MDKLQFAGQVDIKSVIIRSLNSGYALNLVNQVIGLDIYEDIFSPFIHGSVSIKESLDLISDVPYVGEETLELEVITPGLDKVFKGIFYVYKITDREYVADRSVVYSIHFVSQEAIHNSTKAISKTFNGKVSTLVKNLIREQYGLGSVKPYFFEETGNNITYTSNYWKPVENISFLTKRAKTKNQRSSYLFYENRDGFNFTSYDELAKQQTYQKFNYDNSKMVIENGTTYRDVNRDYSRIIRLSTPELFNYIESNDAGKFASKVFAFDLLSKKLTSRNYLASSKFNKVSHLNKFKTSSKYALEKLNSHIFTQLLSSEVHSGAGGNTTYYDIQDRYSLLKQLTSLVNEIEVAGRLDYTIGKKVNVNVFKAAPIDNNLQSVGLKQDILDTVNSGDYIVTAIHHAINLSSHTCLMEIAKDSLLINLDKR